MLLPHELVAGVHACGPSVFAALFLDDACTCEQFWRHVSASPWGQRHPVFREPSLLGWTIPLRFHGDDASTKSLRPEKFAILSIHGALSRGLTSLESRLLVCCLPDARLVHGVTLRELSRVLEWSFGCLADGLWPTHDHAGVAFPKVGEQEAGHCRWWSRGRRLAGCGSLSVRFFRLPALCPLQL